MPSGQRNRRQSLDSPRVLLFLLIVFNIIGPPIGTLALAQVQDSQESLQTPLQEVPVPILEEVKKDLSEQSAFFEILLDSQDFNQFITEKGIQRSDRVSTYLLLKAEEALDRGKGEEAIQLSTKASQISPTSPTPYFFLVKAVWRTDPTRVVDMLFHFANGAQRIFDDFLFVVPVFSPFLLFLLLAILLGVLSFIVYSLFNFFPIWTHQISELSKGYLHPVPAASLFTLLLFAPLLMGFPVLWCILFAFLLFWGFYNRAEKAIVFAFTFLIGTTPWILPVIFTLFTANGGLLLDEMSRNYHSDYLWTPPPVDLNESGWESAFIRASYEAQRGNYQKATLLYQKALKNNPDAPMILNNLGNISFYRKDYKTAIEYYEKAIAVAPGLISARYNMSQAYREMLLFKKGEAVFAEASKLDAQSTENFTIKSARYPNFPVIDERFSETDVMKRLLLQTGDSDIFSENLWQGLIGPVALRKAPFIAIFWIILLSISSTLHKKCMSGKQCAFCKKAICGQCERRLFSYQVCRPCEMRFMTVRRKSDFALVEDAVKRIPFRLYPLFVLPGGGHLAIRRTKTGFFLLSVFFILLASIFVSDVIIPPTEWYLHRSGTLFPLGFLFLLYMGTCLDLIIKRSQRKWL